MTLPWPNNLQCLFHPQSKHILNNSSMLLCRNGNGLILSESVLFVSNILRIIQQIIPQQIDL